MLVSRLVLDLGISPSLNNSDGANFQLGRFELAIACGPQKLDDRVSESLVSRIAVGGDCRSRCFAPIRFLRRFIGTQAVPALNRACPDTVLGFRGAAPVSRSKCVGFLAYAVGRKA